ncbi:MAG: hypothetical protein JKY34_12425 [Kordiimonadaceae bacterium]|nr:hypothetical protein [Kordiimonadaceae bacterium]
MRSYADDFYYRVHITPRRLNLGNVASTQASQITVWNAWFVPLTLDSISGLEPGVTLSGQSNPPVLYPALAELSYDLGIDTSGPSNIDLQLQWLFDNGNMPGLRVTGTRIVPWGFAPNWNKGIKEHLAWATDILQSPTAAEQRRALRLSPRREFTATMLLAERDRQRLDLALFAWSGQVWALPLWHQIQGLQAPLLVDALRIDCDTVDREFTVGGLVILQGETPLPVEVAEVLAIDGTGIDLARELQSAWAKGSRIFPGQAARLTEQPKLKRISDTADELVVTFIGVEANDHPAVLPATMYRGFPVLEERPNESKDLSHTLQRLQLALDNGTGIAQITDTAGRAFPVRQHRWLLDGRAQQAAFRSLLYGLEGRLVAVWLPTHADDLTLLADMSNVQLSLDIANIDYARFGLVDGAPAPGRRDIRIELRDGTAFHRRITGATEIDADLERLTIDSALGVAINTNQVLRISWLFLCRLDQDGIDIEHLTDAEGVALSDAIFKGVRDDEL